MSARPNQQVAPCFILFEICKCWRRQSWIRRIAVNWAGIYYLMFVFIVMCVVWLIVWYVDMNLNQYNWYFRLSLLSCYYCIILGFYHADYVTDLKLLLFIWFYKIILLLYWILYKCKYNCKYILIIVRVF